MTEFSFLDELSL